MMGLAGGRATVGLVIRPGAVEIVQLSQELRGAKLLHAARVPLTAPQAGGQAAPAAAQLEDARIAEAIRKAMASVHTRTKRVAVAISPHEVVLRSFTIPSVPRAEMEAAVQFEARKYIPFKLTDLLWDFTVSPRAGDKTLDVVFTALEREVFARIQRWLTAAGVEATLVEPQSFSLARVARLSQQAPGERFITVVDIQPESAHIAVVKNGLAYLARDVNLEAAATAQTETTATVGPDPSAERLLSELRLSADFFTRQCPGATIDRIVLFGEASRVGAWCQAFAPHLRCPVEPGKLPAALGFPEGAAPASAVFAVAVGTALGSGGKYRTAAPNFLMRNQKSMAAAAGGQWNIKELASGFSFRALNRSVLGGVATVSMVLLCALWLFGAQQVDSARRELERSMQNRPDVGWGLMERSRADLDGIGQPARERLAFLRRVIEGRVSVAGRLDALVRSLPEGIWLAGLQYDDHLGQKGEGSPRLTLEGACFLKEGGQEVPVIQQFEERTKLDGHFYRGFATSQLGEITEHADERQAYSYRTFRLEYSSDRRL